jgi:hypothetical protein
MKIANPNERQHVGAQVWRSCSRMPFANNSSKSSQLAASRPGKRNHHV